MFMPALQSGSISIPRMQRYQNCVNVVFRLSSHLLHTLTFFIAVFGIITMYSLSKAATKLQSINLIFRSVTEFLPWM